MEMENALGSYICRGADHETSLEQQVGRVSVRIGLFMRFVEVLLACSLLQQFCSAGDSSAFKLRPVKQNLSENGGCAVTLSKDVWHGPYVFTSDYQNHASVNLEGSDRSLTLVKSRENSLKRDPRIGERSSYWYAGKGLRVRVDYVVTGVCPPDSESCEVFYYRAELSITIEHRTEKVVGRGICGV